MNTEYEEAACCVSFLIGSANYDPNKTEPHSLFYRIFILFWLVSHKFITNKDEGRAGISKCICLKINVGHLV